MTAFAQHLGDEVAAHQFVHVSEVRDAYRRAAALDDNFFALLDALLDGVGGGVGPEVVLAVGERVR